VPGLVESLLFVLLPVGDVHSQPDAHAVRSGSRRISQKRSFQLYSKCEAKPSNAS
jgi:hypothetical protein